MINTYNESSLHRTIKSYYASLYEGAVEVEKDGHILDILAGDNHVIEIQNLNLSKLTGKISHLLENHYKVTLVHTIPVERYIENYNKEGDLISRKKSPKKQSIYDLFRELTGIYPLLLNKNFELHVLEIKMTEIRIKEGELVQSQNNRRRFRKDYIKSNKKLDEIIKTHFFKTADNYLSLIPDNLKNSFCAKDLKIHLETNKLTKANADRNAHLLIWVLLRMELIEYTETKNRSRYYRISSSNNFSSK